MVDSQTQVCGSLSAIFVLKILLNNDNSQTVQVLTIIYTWNEILLKVHSSTNIQCLHNFQLTKKQAVHSTMQLLFIAWEAIY